MPDEPEPRKADDGGVGAPDDRPEADGALDDRPPAPPHDPAGLDAARAVASGLRGAAGRRPAPSATRRSNTADPRLSGAHPDDRDPALLGRSVDRLVTDAGWVTDVAVYGVFGRWASIVGADVAAHCSPESFVDGRLSVRTDSTAWATQLRLLAPTVVRRLNEELGEDTVSRLDVSGPAAPSWKRGNRSVRGSRGPRDTYG